MFYLASAKLVVAAHFGFVAFVFFGAFLFSNYPKLVWVHGGCVAYAILITIVGWACPLTLLEQWLLGRAGVPVYSGEFLPHYVWSHFGFSGSEVSVAAGMVVAVLAANWLPYRSMFRAESWLMRLHIKR